MKPLTRKKLFKPKDPFEREIEATKQRISGRHKPALDFAKARQTVREIKDERVKA